MSDADRERWNARYAAGEYAARTHPSPLLAAWIDRLPRGRALDVACGLGRNAIHLAAQRLNVRNGIRDHGGLFFGCTHGP